MNCREFRRKHDAYIDDTLSGVEIDGMINHRRLCEACAQLDTRNRRALLLARNLPTIQPSQDFTTRLHARLADERSARQLAMRPAGGDVICVRPLSPMAYAIITAGVFAVAGLAGAATRIRTSEDAILLTPVVASKPEIDGTSELERVTFSAPLMVAELPAAMPVWPAVADSPQGQWQFAGDLLGR